MKIALLGYGKMGKAIEGFAIDQGDEIVLRADNREFDISDLAKADVAIEFSTPATALENIKKCADVGVPVVVGTTAWYDDFDEAVSFVNEKNSGLFTATNFSIGVNLFWKISSLAASVMDNYSEYEPSIDEIHHKQKLDAPSGTAITTAEKLLQSLSRKNHWIHHENGVGSDNNELELTVRSYREDNVPGTHTIKFDNAIDSIEIKHTAHSREGFAKGALKAASFMVNKRGVFTMNDLLNL